ncbi:hypothetical protein [Bradyrhizobium sp. Leo121]|uniref:hypothetical protein n=1 Tax=Bradyrhizobium sp. Leo121 TaxID=1571195 RepID=UPI001029F057|nr:hypothetical protein [Bradyrhizobium sp. Leo121]
MKIGFGIAAAILALSLTAVIPSVQACNGGGNCDNAPGRDPPGQRVGGAPGPIAGAGLPILAVGYGVYWLIRRRRKQD